MPFVIKTPFSISFKKKHSCLSFAQKALQKSPIQPSSQNLQKAGDSPAKKLFLSTFKKKDTSFFSMTVFSLQSPFYKLEKALENIPQLTFLCQQNPQFLCMQDHQGNTALHLASGQGQLDAIIFLCEKEPKLLLIKNKQGNTALHLASMQGQLDASQFLCQKSPHLLYMKNLDGDTAFHLAVANGHLNIVMQQYDQDRCLLHQQNKQGLLPLEVALYFNQTHVKTFLIQCYNKTSSFFPIFCMYVVLFLFKILDFLCKKLLK